MSWGFANFIHGKLILDLVFTDGPACTTSSCAAVSDYKSVLNEMKLNTREIASHQREVWHVSEVD